MVSTSCILKLTRMEFSLSLSWRWWWRILAKCQQKPSCCGWSERWEFNFMVREAGIQFQRKSPNDPHFSGEWRQSVRHHWVQRVSSGFPVLLKQKWNLVLRTRGKKQWEKYFPFRVFRDVACSTYLNLNYVNQMISKQRASPVGLEDLVDAFRFSFCSNNYCWLML